MARIHLFALLLGAFFALATAASPQNFCKCTCFKNSTIIPLSTHRENQLLLRSPHFTSEPFFPAAAFPSDDDEETETEWSAAKGPDGSGGAPSSARRASAKRAPSACAACNKTFCREHNLPFCHDATDEDMTTECFQRDSAKDRLIVWAFILGTLGLLGWAAFRKVRDAREARGREGHGGVGWWTGMFSRGRSGGYRPIGESG